MRSSNISNRFEALLFAALLVGCSSGPSSTSDGGSDAAAPGCVLELTGNLTDEASPTTCATVSPSDAGGYVLDIDTSTSQIARIQASIALGTSPMPGQLTNESVTDWSMIALESASSCFFQAGSTSVPAGSFTLDLAAFDASTQTAHGTLTITAYVHAPPTTNCSYGDLETIKIHF